MKAKMILCLLIGLMLASFTSRSVAQVTVVGDTTWITGGTFSGGENLGLLEATINGDTTTSGARKNVNMVYALYQGQVYYQVAPINVNNPTGTLIIVGVPHGTAKAKPIILVQPTGTVHVAVGGAVNQVYGSLKMVNVHYQTMQMDGYQNNELFFCGTSNQLPQVLTVDNCLFEFSNIDIFDCTNETGAIGGWPYGAKFFITNSYFRNLFYAGQWWGSRVMQCKHPIDTLWVENNTITTGGLTFLQQNEITDFAYFNHNTIVNNKKYWLLSPYHRSFFVTNNIFINQDWVGEDANVTNSGQDPDKIYMSTISVDTNNATNGLVVMPKYQAGDSTHYSPVLALNRLQCYISNNVNYYDPQLVSGYYNSATYILADTGSPAQPFNAIPSYLGWFYPSPQKVGNMPGAWMNSRTSALFAAYGPPNGGFIEHSTTTADPQTATPAIPSAAIVTMMAQWNQNTYGDPRFASPPAIDNSAYIYGDYQASTLPGIVGGAKTDGITQTTALAAGDQVGIAKFTDLTESFKQTTVSSDDDNFPVGSLIWDDTQNASYAAAHAGEWPKILAAYLAKGGVTAVKAQSTVATTFSLSQNYPNPFNPSTQIDFSLPQQSTVELKVFNLLGQEVATLIHGSLSAGLHVVNFDAHNLASGLYIYRITAGNFTSVKKMMLLK
jgi:hypothetical protein